MSALAQYGTRPAALVTGGARRLGREMALALARRGFDLALHYRSAADQARALAAAVEAQDRRCLLFGGDLESAAQTAALVDRVAAELPALAVVVNNASSFEAATLEATSIELFDRNLALHLRAPFLLARLLAARLPDGVAGLIVNLVDTRVAGTPVEHFAYTLSKKALLDFTALAARALGPRLRVNAIAPGLVLAPAGAPPGYLEERARRIPLERPGSPADVVRALDYLLDAPFVTGQCLFVDGGEHLL